MNTAISLPPNAKLYEICDVKPNETQITEGMNLTGTDKETTMSVQWDVATNLMGQQKKKKMVMRLYLFRLLDPRWDLHNPETLVRSWETEGTTKPTVTTTHRNDSLRRVKLMKLPTKWKQFYVYCSKYLVGGSLYYSAHLNSSTGKGDNRRTYMMVLDINTFRR